MTLLQSRVRGEKALVDSPRGFTKGSAAGKPPSELAAHLAGLGLEEADLAEVVARLQLTPPVNMARATPRERLLEAMQGQDLLGRISGNGQGRASVPPAKTITLYLAEEQQIFRETYQTVFRGQSGIEVLSSSPDTSAESLVAAAAVLQPSVMVLGVKGVQSGTVEKLELVRQASSQVGLVLLFAYYNGQGIKALREFSSGASAGCAYLLKHTIDTPEQLVQVVRSVAEQRIILDPVVMEELIRTRDSGSSFTHELSPKELEVLRWLARGYRNDAIARLLNRDVKTIERHINNIYSKLENDGDKGADDGRHPRVHATLTYLRSAGLLLASSPGDL